MFLAELFLFLEADTVLPHKIGSFRLSFLFCLTTSTNLLLQKYSAAADTNTGTAEAVRGFRMAVLTSLKHFNPNDLDAFAMVCSFQYCYNINYVVFLAYNK